MGKTDKVLEVENVHLSYKFIKAQGLKHTLLNKKRREIQYFEALKGISFSLERGINLGIIGSNGSGKSTLLRVIANTLTPDKGTVQCKAKSISLLSLGVGFKADLTGHENIYLNGLLLGLSRSEIDERMKRIISFAELGEFIYNPVRTYSSGMKSRLSFSIAINVDPDLLLIDELFSVGDEHFRKKSREKMVDMINDKRSVIMVSHSMDYIQKYSHQVMWLDQGQVIEIGEPERVVSNYLKARC